MVHSSRTHSTFYSYRMSIRPLTETPIDLRFRHLPDPSYYPLSWLARANQSRRSGKSKESGSRQAILRPRTDRTDTKELPDSLVARFAQSPRVLQTASSFSWVLFHVRFLTLKIIMCIKHQMCKWEDRYPKFIMCRCSVSGPFTAVSSRVILERRLKRRRYADTVSTTSASQSPCLNLSPSFCLPNW